MIISFDMSTSEKGGLAQGSSFEKALMPWRSEGLWHRRRTKEALPKRPTACSRNSCSSRLAWRPCPRCDQHIEGFKLVHIVAQPPAVK